MAFRGGGRGRGRRRGFGGGSGCGFAKEEPFEFFPEIELPKIPTMSKEQEALVIEQRRLENFWKTSPYFLEESTSKESIFSDSFHKKSQGVDIERYSDRKRPNNRIVRDSLGQYLVLSRFPKELVEDSKGKQPSRKRARWNLDSELQKLDVFEKLEQMAEGEGEDREDKTGGEDGDEDGDEDEDEDEDEEEGVKEESSDTDGDYKRNIDFDDDEDDYIDGNGDGGDDEGFY
jgi:DNA-directed RNA polymerase III subunit RPC7